jgi:hypothetical protein
VPLSHTHQRRKQLGVVALYSIYNYNYYDDYGLIILVRAGPAGCYIVYTIIMMMIMVSSSSEQRHAAALGRGILIIYIIIIIIIIIIVYGLKHLPALTRRDARRVRGMPVGPPVEVDAPVEAEVPLALQDFQQHALRLPA